MKKFTRKVRKALKAEMPRYHMQLNREINRRAQAEIIAADLKDEVDDMKNTIVYLTDEKVKALNKVDEVLEQSLEVRCQLQDANIKGKELEGKLASLTDDYNELVNTLHAVSKTSMDRLNKTIRLEKKIDELQKQLDADSKPWYKRLFKQG